VLAAAGERGLEHGVPIGEVEMRQKVALRDLFIACGIGAQLHPEAVLTADLELKHAGYLMREREAASRLAKLAGLVLPDKAPYAAMHSVSVKARQTLAQAASILGVSPADLQNLVLEVERWRRA